MMSHPTFPMKNSMVEGIEHTSKCVDIQYLLEPQIQSPVESDVSSEYVRRPYFVLSNRETKIIF